MKSYSDFKTDTEYRKYMRSYYAGLAMQAIISNPNELVVDKSIANNGYYPELFTKKAFEVAEDMVKRISTNQYDNEHINKN